MAVANTLANYDKATIKAEKRFMLQVDGLYLKHFFYEIYGKFGVNL
jgi:hypothetical protein